MNQSYTALMEQVQNCRLCPRLTAWREEIARVRKRAHQKEEYWGRPVPSFGDDSARVLIVGLAPGAHGSNRTGRMFTGDASGDFLFQALFKTGFANQAKSMRRGDGLLLTDAMITAICHCVPPDNKPTREEINHCLPYLSEEIRLLGRLKVIVALGRLAYEGILRTLPGYITKASHFAHGLQIDATGLPVLITSYHPSRQNTQTGRLTRSAFDSIWEMVNSIRLNEGVSACPQ